MISILGIDIAKEKFDVALLLESKVQHKIFANKQEGFIELSKWLAKEKVTQLHACLEATGIYGEDLAMFLYQAGHIVLSIQHAYRLSLKALCLVTKLIRKTLL